MLRRAITALSCLFVLSAATGAARAQSADAALFEAIVHAGLPEVKAALDAGASVNARNVQTWTPAIAAVAMSNVEVLRYLVSKGADIHAVTRTGMNAMRYAGFTGCAPCVPYLVSLGVDPAGLDPDGWSAMHYAAMTGQAETINALHAVKAPVNVKNGLGDTPLHLAVANANGETVLALMKAGADPTIENGIGLTPLQSATWREEQAPRQVIEEYLKARRP